MRRRRDDTPLLVNSLYFAANASFFFFSPRLLRNGRGVCWLKHVCQKVKKRQNGLIDTSGIIACTQLYPLLLLPTVFDVFYARD